MLDRPERETREAKDARMIAATRKQVRKRGSTQFFDHRTILLCRLLDAAEAERDAALAAAPDARLAEALRYVAGMRDAYPNTCWALSEDEKRCCIRERGHDGGKHEPLAAAREETT
jgi:hypothetical protein